MPVCVQDHSLEHCFSNCGLWW